MIKQVWHAIFGHKFDQVGVAVEMSALHNTVSTAPPPMVFLLYCSCGVMRKKQVTVEQPEPTSPEHAGDDQELRELRRMTGL